jgi:hypothetical protein
MGGGGIDVVRKGKILFRGVGSLMRSLLQVVAGVGAGGVGEPFGNPDCGWPDG